MSFLVVSACALFLGCTVVLSASEQGKKSYLEFRFTLPCECRNPFAREVDALVALPGDRSLKIPAFCLDGRNLWAVRIRVDREGDYRLLALTEKRDGVEKDLSIVQESPLEAKIAPLPSHGFVRIDAHDPRRFAFEDGTPFTPFGANHAWVFDNDYEAPFAEFERQGLNWSRLWMVHWGHSNLEWLDRKQGASPLPGYYDLGAARFWDSIVASAERHGVFFQLVFQHHGQYSTEVNPSWGDNPWNAANGGFLKTPGEFFTSEEARRLTRQKLRYSVARWGYSTSIMAWELFNEVMFTDAYRLERNLKAVSDWHAEMAAYLRAIDPYRHLITTSLNELESPLNAGMDFLQPHIYAFDMVAAMRRVPEADKIAKPVFYGEQGDDKVGTKEDKETATTLDYATWASLAGEMPQPGQAWYADRLLSTGRISALGSAARFAAHTRLFERRGFSALEPEIESEDRVPASYKAAFEWEQRKPAKVRVTESGIATVAQADIPYIVVGTEQQTKAGHADRIDYLFDRVRETKGVLRFDDCGPKGAKVEVLLDNQLAASHVWPARPQPEEAARKVPVDIPVVVPEGQHTLRVVNRGEDSVRLASLDLDYTFPALAAFGKKNSDFAVLFVWHRQGVQRQGGPAATGRLALSGLAEGRWQVTWWDIAKGAPGKAETLIVDKGILRLETPAIDRYGMVALEKLPRD